MPTWLIETVARAVVPLAITGFIALIGWAIEMRVRKIVAARLAERDQAEGEKISTAVSSAGKLIEATLRTELQKPYAELSERLRTTEEKIATNHDRLTVLETRTGSFLNAIEQSTADLLLRGRKREGS